MKTSILTRKPAMLAILCGAVCCSSAYADLFFTITDAGAGNTNWSITGSGVAIPFDPFSPIAEVIVPSHFGNFSFVSAGNTILGTGNWTIGGLPVMRTFWVGEGALDGLNDFLLMDFNTSVASGLDLSTASGTVVFPIPISAFDSASYAGTSIQTGGQPPFNAGGVYISVPAVPEPSVATALFASSVLLLSIRHKRNERNA